MRPPLLEAVEDPDGAQADATRRWKRDHGSRSRRCSASGEKRNATAAEAQRLRAALDREDREDLGLHAPLVAGLPLRLARVLRRRRAS
jgi:hypothetical protein